MAIINQFLDKEVDRKEFFLYCGMILLAISGISTLLKSIEHIMTSKTLAKQSSGFGASSYGGKKEGF